jgi:photosystem II stability/assembly factor-like uncharacterized protein
MKKTLTVLLLMLCVSTQVLLAQNYTWKKIDTGGLQGQMFEDLTFTSDNDGFGVGTFGMKRTRDGGLTWTTVTLPTPKWLRNIFFLNATTGWAVGDDGMIIKTTDGGNTWVQQTSNLPALYTIWGIHFVDATTGYAAGNYQGSTRFFMKSTDGGTTWVTQTFRGSLVYDLFFPTSTVGVAVGASASGSDRIVVRTPDAGATWPVVVNLTGNAGCYSVHFTDANKGFATGPAGMIRTTDGGLTWNGVGSVNYLHAIHFADATNGMAVGRDGKVIQTIDGGNTWVSQPNLPIGTGNYFRAVYVRNKYKAFAAGDGSYVYVYQDWTPAITPGNNPAVNQGVTTASLSYTSPVNSPDRYSIVYSAAAHAAGFIDVTNAVLPASSITLAIPANAPAPAIYSADLTVSNSSTGYSSAVYPIKIGVNKVATTSITSMQNPRIWSKADQVNNVFQDAPTMYAMAWTWSGQPGILRTLIRFDLSSIPQNAVINAATLELKGDNHNPLNYSNASAFYKVSQAWDYTNASWTNMNNKYYPSINVQIAGTTSPNENRSVNLTAMVQDWVSSPSTNYGLMFKLLNETAYTTMQFGTDEKTDVTKKPNLSIDYTVYAFAGSGRTTGHHTPTPPIASGVFSQIEFVSDSTASGIITISPIPAVDHLSVFLPASENGSGQIRFEIYHNNGNILLAGNIGAGIPADIDISGLTNGIYYIVFSDKKTRASRKFIVSH